MTVYTTRTPRGTVVSAINDITNPSLESTAPGWSSAGYGAGGNGSDSLAAAPTQAPNGRATTLCKTWSNAATNSGGAGSSWAGIKVTPGQVKYFQAQLYCTSAQGALVSLQWKAADGTILSNEPGQSVAVAANTWTRVQYLTTVPANAATVTVSFVLAAGGVIPNGMKMYLDAASSCTTPDGNTIPGYFDGASPSDGYYTFGWEGAADASRSFRYAPDPLSIITPQQLADKYSWSVLGKNTIHQLLAGGTAATIIPGGARSGTLKFLFLNRADAKNCTDQHLKVGTWAYVDSVQPEANMTYVVTPGPINMYQDDSRLRWIVEIPFSEVTA